MIICIKADVFMEIGDKDPEDVCSEFDQGAESALAHFPDGEILQVDVDHYESLSKKDIKERGFDN